MELVLKLQQMGLLDTELLYTINGREYLTIDQLRTEVRSLLKAAGGRIAVVCAHLRCMHIMLSNHQSSHRWTFLRSSTSTWSTVSALQRSSWHKTLPYSWHRASY